MSTTSSGKRVTAFVLASLFLFSTVGATAYVIWQINQEETGIGLAEEEQEEAPTPKLKGTTMANYTPSEEAVTALRSEDISVGTGAEVKVGDTISVVYTGALAKTGVIFDTSVDTGAPATFQLVSGGLIEGWIQGIPGMKEGGKRRLYIPATLAYADQEVGDIPANSDLVFDVEIQAVVPAEQQSTEGEAAQ